MDFLLFRAELVWEDLCDLASAYPDPQAHAEALAAILHQLAVVHLRQPGKDIQGRWQGWRRHAFQSQPQRGARADLRIVYRRHGDSTILLGFGHRHLPEDFYQRLRGRPAI